MLIYFFILLGAVLRVVPHPDNFAPIGAIALFAGAYLDKRLAPFAAIGAMVISDFFIGFDSLESRLTVYSALLAGVLLGFWIRKDKSFSRIVASSLLASVVFYLITNFAYLYPASMYPHNWAGIIQSYINALPFFRNTLMSDLIYTAAFFGVYELVMNYYFKLKLSSRT